MELNKQKATIRSSVSDTIIDQGLRSYMLKVYNYMASGVLLTGFVALILFKFSVVTNAEGEITGLTNLGNSIYNTGLAWVIILAPLGIVFYMSFGIAKMSASKAQTVLDFCGLNGSFFIFNFFSIHRNKHNKSFLYNCWNIRRNEYLRIYD